MEDDNTENICEETEPFATADEIHDETNESDMSTETFNPNTQAGLSNTTSQTQFTNILPKINTGRVWTVDVAEKRVDEDTKNTFKH